MSIELVLEFADHDSRRARARARVSLGNDWLSSSTLEDVMRHPSALNVTSTCRTNTPNQQFSLRFLQTSIPESEWSRTTLKKLMGLTKNTTTTRALFMLDTTNQPQQQPQQQQHDNHDNTNDVSTSTTNIQKAMDTLLTHNFDADTKVCIVTLLKMIENLIQQPTNQKVRSIRVGNPTFHSKVACRPGGVDILMACGFTRETPSPGLLSSTSAAATTASNDSTTATTMLVLLPSNESTSTLLEARSMLVQCALQQLQMTTKELPTQKPPPPPVTVGASRSNNKASFDPYKTQRHDGASSAAGMKVTPDSTYVSTTEKQLHQLEQKQTKLEQSNLGGKPFERQLVAGLPGTTSTTSSSMNVVDVVSSSTTSAKGDGSLLAQQFQKRQQERLAREEGGFTTKAMRDLEKMKTQKVYKFVSLKIQFADGSHVQGKFRPHETVATLIKVIQKECLVWSDAAFDVYVAPPRRLLQPAKTLKEEGLVPAAKIFVSWKVESTPSEGTPVGSFLKPELFSSREVEQPQFPNGIPLVGGGGGETKKSTTTKKSQENTKAATTAEEREEEMMKRMMGGRGRKTKSKLVGGSTTKKTTSNKPKWFK